MNKHFEDARYYLVRALENARRGVREELEPIEERFREMTGGDEEPEGGRIDRIREELGELQGKAEGETREAIAEARSKLDAYRNKAN